MISGWSTPDDIASQVRRPWDNGSLLRDYAAGSPFEVVDLPLRGPKPSQIGDDLDAVRSWVTRLDAGRRDDKRYSLTWHTIGGRRIGRNDVPARALVSSFDQAWELLGVRAEVKRFDDILAAVDGLAAVREWAVNNPHRALELHDDLPRLSAAYVWLDSHRGSGRYLREISAPGVDTKFAERYRPVLAAMLRTPTTPSGFLSALGLATKPEFVRIRPAMISGLPAAVTELAMRPRELAALAVRPRSAVVVENEITYLSVEVPPDGVVIWGKGFDVDRVGRLPWLVDVDITYWGDVDTHGFAILDRLRAWLPQTRSILMDRETLLAHRERWGDEERPTRASLARLTPSELDLYTDLVTDRLGQRIRLEQERIDWSWVQDRIGRSARR